MIYYENGKYYISNLKVHYIDEHEGEVIKFVGQEGKQWWIEFAELWKETFELVGFEETQIKDEWIERLEEINNLNLPEEISLIEEYVYDEDVSQVDSQHPLYKFKLEKELLGTQKLVFDIQKNALLGGM